MRKALGVHTGLFRSDNQECRVATGRWWAPHLGHHLENPRHLDADHHVPLRNAHLSGGWAWDEERKEKYANYLGDPDHLIAISSRHNRSKGARGPEEWAPPYNSLWCDYATDWTSIKAKWDLTMATAEAETVTAMLTTCETRVSIVRGIGSGVQLPPPKPRGSVYENCEVTAAAGEERSRVADGGSPRRWSQMLEIEVGIGSCASSEGE